MKSVHNVGFARDPNSNLGTGCGQGLDESVSMAFEFTIDVVVYFKGVLTFSHGVYS